VILTSIISGYAKQNWLKFFSGTSMQIKNFSKCILFSNLIGFICAPIIGHLDRFSRPSIEIKYVLEFVSYFITLLQTKMAG
jgi:hypothetical protein